MAPIASLMKSARAPFVLISWICYSASAQGTSTAVGEYVASGLGISSTTQSSSTYVTPTDSGTLPMDTFPVTGEGGVVVTATRLLNGIILAPGTTVYPDQLVQPNATQTISSSPSGRNVSVDECWSSWDQYWSASKSSRTATSFYYPTRTLTETTVLLNDGNPGETSTGKNSRTLLGAS